MLPRKYAPMHGSHPSDFHSESQLEHPVTVAPRPSPNPTPTTSPGGLEQRQQALGQQVEL